MNTPGSVLLGWVVLIAAGGGAFYYAKKDINARRRAQELSRTRPPEKLEWWQKVELDEKTKMTKNSNDEASGSGSSNGNG
ncbi:21681_t:CDS:2 [Cetraspora pellucida]|uniref:21681_t:CDS:1 n=1 Tax=Cetraspora pellucida TaxID=1433469 RepID=A0A9N9CT47_9GLOM|nr:21681_t:CDS:2 [Cetraspora pellucida]